MTIIITSLLLGYGSYLLVYMYKPESTEFNSFNMYNSAYESFNTV